MTTLRRARPDDSAAIWSLLREVFRAGETYAVDPRISRDAALSYWVSHAREAYVAEINAEIVGTYYIKTNQAGGGAHICNCGYVVSAAVRGQGIATEMCLHSQAVALDLGYRAMQFNLVLASNGGAVRLWERLGFERVGTIPEAFAHPKRGFVDAFVMHKRLEASV
ncbi:GNAT family N-acetyltransferase [Yoonia sp.]|uniref:GNAT family N-acetyltransferase n=1 Tax=Yoonia sp. TaxID=2212373 RepID=UPI0023B61AAA